MLNIFYGDMKEAVYNTASYFKYDYEDDWITDPFVKEMIQDVDQSIVLDSGVIDSPVLGKIPPTGLSGGVKTLILVKFDKDKIFNASTCGDNCAKWLLKIAEKEDRTINLTSFDAVWNRTVYDSCSEYESNCSFNGRIGVNSRGVCLIDGSGV